MAAYLALALDLKVEPETGRVKVGRTRVTSIDWSSYPMLRFENVPDEIAVHVIDRPADIRMTDLPLTRRKVVAGLRAISG